VPEYLGRVPHPSSMRLLVLHGLRLKHVAEPANVVSIFGVDEADGAAELKDAAAEGLVQRREGQLAGWQLTPAGRAEHDRLVAAELDASGNRSSIQEAYDRFRDVNPELLTVCTAWQLRDGVLNDHGDEEYDHEVIEGLGQVHESARPIVADLAAALERFGCYPVRLGGAFDHVLAGETAWFTRPMLDSYHTIWFELHEDLLSTLGLERGAESARSGDGTVR
jgi:hypothetical protein